MHAIQGVHGCTQSCTVHAPLILTALPIDIYIFGISPTFLIIWDHFGQNWRHFLKKYFFSPKGPPFGFWALKNQKNQNCEKFWPDSAKPLFIWLYGTHKLLDSVEKSQTPENFFYYVPQWLSEPIRYKFSKCTEFGAMYRKSVLLTTLVPSLES